jgi:hypothetical protein
MNEEGRRRQLEKKGIGATTTDDRLKTCHFSHIFLTPSMLLILAAPLTILRKLGPSPLYRLANAHTQTAPNKKKKKANGATHELKDDIGTHII